MCDVSIIVVSWNTKVLVQQCLASIRETCQTLATEVFLVDNASSDGTPDMVAREFPEVTLIRNPANLGFAKANNVALSLATGRFIALINSDVTVLDGCLQRLVQYMEQNPAIGMLGPRMLTPAGTAGPSCMRQPSLSIWLAHALGLASVFKGSALHIENTNCESPQEVDVLNGWFWLVRKSAVDEVGGLDERFFMYGEDIEWCCRFRRRGWKAVYYPAAAAIHYGGASSSRDPVRFHVEMNRARLQYWRLSHNRVSQVAYLAILVLHQGIRLLGFGLAYALKLRSREQALFKIKRSAACLQWLIEAAFTGRSAASGRKSAQCHS